MKKNSILCLLFTVAILISSCKSDSTASNKVKPYDVLIYLDFTESIDSATAYAAIAKIQKVVLSLPPASKFALRIIHSNPLEENTVEKETLPLNSSAKSTDSKQKLYINYLKRLSLEIDSVLKNKYHQIRSTKNTNPRSCIISTLKPAYDYFLDHTEYEKYLLYFSDMVEQCDAKSSSAGSNYMCSVNRPNYNTIAQNLETNFAPNFNLYNVVGANLSFVLTTKIQGTSNCLNPNEVEGLWKIICKKLGYQDTALVQLSFRIDLPQKFSTAYSFGK